MFEIASMILRKSMGIRESHVADRAAHRLGILEVDLRHGLNALDPDLDGAGEIHRSRLGFEIVTVLGPRLGFWGTDNSPDNRLENRHLLRVREQTRERQNTQDNELGVIGLGLIGE